MTVRHEEALSLYIESTTNLEGALTMFIDSTTPPQWLESLCHAPCPTWDYPKLVWTQISWQYLSGVRGCSSPLLHIRTFLLVRVAHLLFVLERAWSVSELVISTLHCMARETKMLKVGVSPCPSPPWEGVVWSPLLLKNLAKKMFFLRLTTKIMLSSLLPPSPAPSPPPHPPAFLPPGGLPLLGLHGL